MGCWAGLACHAQLQLLLSDYVQHYGLRRHRNMREELAPMGPEHCWNAPHWYNGALMVQAPRHSDHHMHPTRAFPDLELNEKTMPHLSYSFPVMGAIALIPRLWKSIMDPRLETLGTTS